MSETTSSRLPMRLRPVLGWHRPLIVFAVANAVLIPVALAGLVVDDRVLVGAPIWLKPLKFAVSFVLFGTTFAWMISLLGRRRRLGNGLGNVVVVTGVIEMVIIVGQVVRGRQSHFNTTTILDGVLWTIMGSAVPGRSPASVSACNTHRRTVSGPSRSCLAAAAAAAVNHGYSARCSSTRRTARCFTAGSIFFGMTPSSRTQKEAAENPYRFSVAPRCTAGRDDYAWSIPASTPRTWPWVCSTQPTRPRGHASSAAAHPWRADRS